MVVIKKKKRCKYDDSVNLKDEIIDIILRIDRILIWDLIDLIKALRINFWKQQHVQNMHCLFKSGKDRVKKNKISYHFFLKVKK